MKRSIHLFLTRKCKKTKLVSENKENQVIETNKQKNGNNPEPNRNLEGKNNRRVFLVEFVFFKIV